MERDTQPSTEPSGDRPVCPACGHVNIPDAAFCSRCGRSLDGDAESGVIAASADSQATSTFEPVTSTVTPPPSSLWARPDSLDGDPGQTSALPTPPAWTAVVDPTHLPARREPVGVRGFWLGVIATVLILAVLAIYIYAAWLSDSARDTIDGWLPWV